jgi:amidase
MDDSIFFATITELAARLAKKEFSSKELTKAFQKRLESVGPRFNALAHLIEKPAIERAEKADWYFKADRVRTPLQGPSVYVSDPEGNVVELKGPPSTP